MEKKTINFVGLGYVGLPAALLLQNSGYPIIGTDINQELISELSNRKKTFDEPGLQEAYDQAMVNGIQFTTKYQQAEIYVVAVPTPFEATTKKIDPTYLVNALTAINEHCLEGAVIIVESTISPGTIDQYVRPIFKNKKVSLCHAPERILPGNILKELRYNSRTIGADNEETAQVVKEIYQGFCEGEIVLTDIKTAELSKVVENTFRDINIAFANELKLICEREGLDVHSVIEIANKHPRVNILNPGTGVGGHCIPVDPWFLVGDYPEQARLIRTAREVNDAVPKRILDKVREVMDHSFSGKRLGIYGLTYKDNVDDVRESPSLQLYQAMTDKEQAEVLFYDPLVKKSIVKNQAMDFDDFLQNTDVVLVMNRHEHLLVNEPLIQQSSETVLDPIGDLSMDKVVL
ncbi:nucleotide sugar dehydrogenase [Enterococcus mundtii]|uniref:nucleotide sugar dehydrogenase n=1 Tax=Enterococcus mundtii TaxID=53346 RepID=UPI00232B42C4|nr:nucleotide sugar dehydrogenase [Enterococcus mundtii]MDB7087605.1 nucleotide sugar dehydrogenase [Enterococcus mundtii]